MAKESSVPGFTQARLFAVLFALGTATMLANLETSIISTALPKIIGDFKAFESYAWVGTAYIVTSAISTPLLGKLSDLGVSQEVGLMIHLPAGQGRCELYLLDLAHGWTLAQIAVAVRTAYKTKPATKLVA